MQEERWEKIERIFNQATLVPVGERIRFIEQNCENDENLRAEVISLLSADEESGDILNQSVFPIVAQLLDKESDRLLEKSAFGSYQLEIVLGRGGMGTVFLAVDKRLGRSVALKVLPPSISESSELVQRFRQEAKAASAISHPNIAHIYEFDKFDGTYFLAMEYVAGKTLRDLIKEKQIDLQCAVDAAIQIAAALQAAHQEHITHRDIKPENIMLTKNNLVKVLDFGLAKLEIEKQDDNSESVKNSDSSFIDTTPGMIIGTTAYMSPEQVRGHSTDPRTDLWSLGVVFYELITGTRPFAGDTRSDIQAAILLKEPDSLPYTEDLPELNRIVKKLLAKDITARYQSAEAILSDLRALKRQIYDYLQTGKQQGSLEYSQPPNSQTSNASNQNEARDNTNSDRIQHQTPDEPESVSVIKSGSINTSFVDRLKNRKLNLAVLACILLILFSGLGYFIFSAYRTNNARPIESVAVLPFVNVNGDPETEILSDGITESLINNLAQLPSIKVINRSSSFKYKGKEANLQEAAEELGVEAILTGRLSKSGENVLISVELVKPTDKTLIWGEQYLRQTSDLLQVQPLISKEIAEKLHIRLTGAQQQRINKRETVNQQAYELVLKGKIYNAKGGEENMKKSLDFLNQAIALDPNYAQAYVWLSLVYRNQVDQSMLTPQEGMPKAESAAYKAIELDENLADAHFALAITKRDQWQWQEAERQFKRSIELNPNFSRAYTGYASFLSLMGRHDEAVAEVKVARELDPLSPIVNANVSWTFYLARRYDEAIEAIQKELELDQENPDAHYILGYIYMIKGMHNEAIREFQETIKLGLDIPGPKIYQAVVYARQGEIKQARTILEQLEASKEYVSPAEMAILYAALNEPDKAFASLENAYLIHDIQLQALAVDAAFDPLRADPRFNDLLRRVGLRTTQ